MSLNKKRRSPNRKELKRASDKAFRVTFAVMLMAVKDTYPDMDIDTDKIISRVKDILNEFNSVGYEEVNLLMQIAKEEFDLELKKL